MFGEQNTFSDGQDFCFYYICLKTIFSGHSKIWEEQKKLGETSPECPFVATGLDQGTCVLPFAIKYKQRNNWKYRKHMSILVLIKSAENSKLPTKETLGAFTIIQKQIPLAIMKEFCPRGLCAKEQLVMKLAVL